MVRLINALRVEVIHGKKVRRRPETGRKPPDDTSAHAPRRVSPAHAASSVHSPRSPTSCPYLALSRSYLAESRPDLTPLRSPIWQDNFQKSIARFCRAQEDADDPPSIDEIRDVVRDATEKSDLTDVLDKLHVRDAPARLVARSAPLVFVARSAPYVFVARSAPYAVPGCCQRGLCYRRHIMHDHLQRPRSAPTSLQEMNTVTQRSLDSFSKEFKVLHGELADLRGRSTPAASIEERLAAPRYVDLGKGGSREGAGVAV